MKSNSEQTSNSIKRFLEVLSSYTFNLYYLKSRDMVLTDFLSRVEGGESDPQKAIPISFISYSL